MRTPTAFPAILLIAQGVAARLLHSLPEDTYAFPKFRVAFLNGLPVLNETAERWLKEGLRGGELEFLDQPWKDDLWHVPSNRKEIGSGHPHDDNDGNTAHVPETNFTLEHMKLGPKDSYICLIPKASQIPSWSQEEESETDATPARSWSLLQPLSGTCLYHRQGWFTYSYCHNEEIRQFKELIPQHSRTPGTYTPEEDPEWESYTLGRAPTVPEPGAALTVAEQDAQAANLELARNAGSRYLVQRWGEGTVCDKTGKHREVEVQFHCSMVMTDHILFVKETKTCSYVLVIHTPRLCGEPGFKSRRDAGVEAHIRCREVVHTKPEGQLALPTADHPLKVPPRKTVLPPAQKAAAKEKGGEVAADKEKMYTDFIRKTLEALMTQDGALPGKVVDFNDENEILIEVDEDDMEAAEVATTDWLVGALRDAGINVEAKVLRGGEKGDNTEKKDERRQKGEKGRDDLVRDEL